MELVFDQINAKVAERAKVISDAVAAKVDPRSREVRRLVEQKTRQLRAIRSQAAARLGLDVLPYDPKRKRNCIIVEKFGQDFLVEAIAPNAAGWDFWNPRKGVHQIYLQATNLRTGEVHVWNGVSKERLQCPNMPTGIRGEKIIGEDVFGLPIYEVIEDPAAAALGHFAYMARIGITEEVATGATPEWGSTSTNVYTETGNVADSSVDGYVKPGTGTHDWQWNVDHAGAGYDVTTAQTWFVHWRTENTPNRFQALYRGITVFPKAAAIGTDVVSSAVTSLMIYTAPDANSDTPVLHGVAFTRPASTIGATAFNKANFGASFTSKAWADIAASSTVKNDFTINETGIAAINASDLFSMGWRLDYDINEVAPTDGTFGETGCGIYYAERTGTDRDPNTVYMHAPAPVGGARPGQKIAKLLATGAL